MNDKYEITGKKVDMFLSRYSDTDDCWEWEGSITKDGYGSFTVNKKLLVAHRFSFIYFNGPIKPGYVIDHMCENRKCVNPYHLQQLTNTQNSMLSTESPFLVNRSKSHCSNGHKFTRDNIYKRKDNQRFCITCNREQNRIRYAKIKALREQGIVKWDRDSRKYVSVSGLS